MYFVPTRKILRTDILAEPLSGNLSALTHPWEVLEVDCIIPQLTLVTITTGHIVPLHQLERLHSRPCRDCPCTKFSFPRFTPSAPSLDESSPLHCIKTFGLHCKYIPIQIHLMTCANTPPSGASAILHVAKCFSFQLNHWRVFDSYCLGCFRHYILCAKFTLLDMERIHFNALHLGPMGVQDSCGTNLVAFLRH
jgi:hypothetical protein